MPINDPFDILRRGRPAPLPQPPDDSQDDDGSSSDATPNTYVSAQQVGRQQVMAQQGAVDQQAMSDISSAQQQQAAQDAAAQKAQQAQDKIDSANQAVQAKADAENATANGVITQAQTFTGSDGKAYIAKMPMANPDGTTAYEPKDLGIKYGPDGSPFNVSRNQWGAQDWSNPYSAANANLKLTTPKDGQPDGGGQIMAKALGKNAAALPEKDVTDQGVTMGGTMKDAQGNVIKDAQGNPLPDIQVAPNAPINAPQLQPEIDDAEQKLVKAAALQRVKDTVGKDHDDAVQTLADATDAHADAVDAAKLANDAKNNPLAKGWDPATAATALQAAQQDASAKAQAKAAAKQDADTKAAEYKKALLDPVAYVQSQTDAHANGSAPSTNGTPPSPSDSSQPAPTPAWPSTLPAEWQGMTGAQLGQVNPPPGQRQVWAQAMQLKAQQEAQGQTSQSNPPAAPGASSAPAAQPTPNPPATGAAPDGSDAPDKVAPGGLAGLITGDAGPPSQPAAPAEKGTWGSWLSNVKTKSVAAFGGAIGDIMKGIGDATYLEAAPEKFLENHVTAPLVKSFMSPANYQKYQDEINAPNPIIAAGNQIKANAEALESGSAALQLPSLGPLKGPTLQVDPNRKDLGTTVVSGAAGMIPMVVAGEAELPIWMNSGYENAVDESKKNGDSPVVTQAKGIVGAVTMGGVSKLFNAFGAPASKFFNPVLWGSKVAADGTTTPLLKVLQGGATTTTANILTQIAKLAGKGGVEGSGFSVGGQIASGDNPYAPADASKNTSDDLSSAGSLAALQVVLGTFTHGKTLHQISKGVDDLVSQTNDARANPPLGQPVQPPLDRATVLAGLIHQNQVVRAQDSFANLQKQYGTLDSNDSLTPQQRLGEKMKAVGQVPAELRSAVVAHLDAAADAQRQTDEAMKAADAEQAKIPPTTPDLGRRSDAYIQANAQDIQQAQQTGQPRQRQLIGNETDADILAESARRQQLATLADQRSQVVAGIASNLKDSLDQTVAMAGTPEGRASLLSLNRFNAAQPSGTPKASATTLQNAMDLAPKPAGDLSLPSVYVEHYLPVSHEIEQLGDPDQKTMATAAIKMTNGRALNSAEQSLMFGDPATNTAPAHDSTTGAPFVTQTNGKPILTDAGLSRLRSLVPAAADILPRNEQAQLEVQPPPLPANGKGAKPQGQPEPPPLNNSLGSQLAGMRGSEPDPQFSNVDDETLGVRHGNANAAIARAKERGGDAPANAYLQRNKMALEIARRAAAIAPPAANLMGALAGAREGDEIDYTRPNHEGQPVQTRGEVTQVGPDHYRVVDTHDGVERTVPISRSVPEPGQVTEAKRNGQSNGHPDQTPGRGAEKDSGVRLPGIDPLQITPQHLETARLLSGIYGKFQATAERLGIDGFSPQSHPDGFIGLAVHPGDLGKIQLDLPRLAQNLAKLRTPAERAARVEEVFDEELRHVALETVAGEDNGVHSTDKADATFSKLWASASKFQKRTVLDLYQKGALAFVDPDRAAKNSKATLENASDANKGREYLRMLSQLQARGRTSEIADLLTPETKTFYEKVVAYLRHVFMRMNDPAAKQLLDQTEQLLQMHSGMVDDDKLDMSPPVDHPPANENDQHPADIALPNGETIPAKYELAELGDIQPSHRNGSPNPDYPAGLNERDYSLSQEKQNNERMIATFDPRRLVTDVPDLTNGPPAVDQDNLVLGGNRRTQLLSDPRAYGRYRPYLQANAERFGLNPDDVSKMQQPVLIRRIQVQPGDRPALIRRFNETPTAALDTANDAVSAGKQITPDLVKSVSDLFQQDPDKTPLQHLSEGDTRAIAQGLLDAGAIRPNDREKYISGNGNLTPEGARFVRNVLLGGILPDANILREVADTPVGTKLLNGLSAVYLMKSRGADIAPLREAVALEADRQRLGIKSASEFQSQGNLAGIGREPSSEAKTIQSLLAGIKSNEARRAFSQLQSLVSPLEPGQPSLFGEVNRKSIGDVSDAELNQVIKSSRKITKAADKLRSVVGAAGIGGGPVKYPGPLNLVGMDRLLPEQRQVEMDFARWVQRDPDRAAAEYAKIPDAEGGRVVDMDIARVLSPDYRATRRSKAMHSVSVQKVVNALAVQKLLPDASQSLRPGDVMGLTAGGPGSGKGNIKKVDPSAWYGARFVYDGVLRNLDFANQLIADATAKGAKTAIWYVHSPIEKAVEQAVGRAEKDGRSIPLITLSSGHVDAQRTMIALLHQHASNPNVEMRLFDNSGPSAVEVPRPLQFLTDPRILYRDHDEALTRAKTAFKDHAEGLTDPVARQIFETGTYSPETALHESPEQRGGRGVAGGSAAPGESTPTGTDKPVAGAEVRQPASVPSVDDPRRAGALKAHQILTGFQAEGKTLSSSQQEALDNATRILSGGHGNDQGLLSLRGVREQHGAEPESDRSRERDEEAASGVPEDAKANVHRGSSEASARASGIQPGAGEAGTGASRQGALKAYHTLTAWKAEGRKLTVYQEQALENAEKILGQQFIPGTELSDHPGQLKSPPQAEALNLRSTRGGRVVHQSLFDMGRDVQSGQSLLFGSAVADRPEMERPLARYVSALRQGELNLNKPVDFAQEYQTDMGQPAPAPLIARAKELEVQPGEADQAGGRTPAELFHNHLDVADRIAASFDNIPGYQPDDARQVARVALQKAAENYNPDQGVPFRGFAPRVVRNALRDAYRFQARRAVEQPTLDRPVDAGSDVTGKDLVPAKEPTASEAAARNDAHAQLRNYIDQAPMVQSSRGALHGLLDGKSQTEMAEELGVSPQRVSAMVGIGLENLRKFFADKGINRGDLLGAAGVHGTTSVDNDQLETYLEHNGIHERQASESIKGALAQSNLPGFAQPYIDRGAGPDPVQRKTGDAAQIARAQVLKNPAEIEKLSQAFATGDTISSILPKYIGGRIPAFDLRGKVVNSPSDFAKLAWAVRSPYVETLKVAVLDGRGKIVHSEVLNVGTLNESLTDTPAMIRAIQQAAGKTTARRVIISHNHPSGDPTPSNADLTATGKIESALKQAGIDLMDHVITNGRSFSSSRLGWRTQELPDAGPSAWEAVPREELARIDSEKDLAPIIRALRQTGPDHTHVIYLNTKMGITAIERLSGGQTYPDLLSKVTSGVAREGAHGVMLSTGDLNPGLAKRMKGDLSSLAKLFDVSSPDHSSFEAKGLLGETPGHLGGGAVRDMIPDFSNTGEFQDTKDAFDQSDPETWPINGKEATALKAQSGDPDDNEQVQALNEIIDKLGEDEWPKPVRDKAEQVRDALVAHLEANNERIAKEGPAWQKVLDDPAREIAHNFQPDDTATWPAKAEAAWNDLDVNEPTTWPAGLEAAAEKAGMVDHDDPETPEIDQDYAQQWMADHVARPEWLKSVDKLPDGAQILNDRAHGDREAEIHAEAEQRTAPSPAGMELRRTADERDAVSRELTQKHGIDRGYLTAYGKTDGPWHARDYGDRDTARSVQMNDEDSARARNVENAYQQARETALATEKAHRANVAQEMANKPLRDYRRPLDAQEGKPDQGRLFGGAVMDAPTDTARFPKDGFAIENYREPDPAHEKHLLDELPSAERARAQIGEKFLGIPIKAAIDKIPLDSDIQKAAELLHNVKDQALKFLAPQVRTEQAGQAGELYSHRAAEYRLMRTQAIEAVKAARTIIDRKGTNALDYTISIARAIESDTPHPDPEAREIVNLFRGINDRFRDMVRSLPGTHFRNYILDYFPHSFADRDQAKAAKYYERKLQGSTAFVKHRSIPTIQEAVDAGLHLKSDNAADLFLMKWDEMLRYKMGQDYLSDLKDNNLARQFDTDAAAPMGWSQIDSRIGKSTVSVPAHRDTPGAYEVKNNQPPLPGMAVEKKFMVDKALHYYAPDSVAGVLNNHLAPGLSDYALYKGSMILANSLNQANLGFSAFHLGFVTCDTMISKQADAMESLIKDRDPVAAAKKMAQAYTPGVAPIMAYLSGSKLMKAALAPGTEHNSELNAMIDAVTKGGGDVKRGEMYSNGWVQAMMQNWRKGTALGYAQAGIRSPLALVELAAHPILGHIVPRVKLGVFMDMARRELRRLGSDASHQDTLRALQGAWASVDNRLGEFVYDNLHVHEGAKHVAFLTVRSVGWNIGTARELGLGTLDGARAAGKIITGKASADDFTHRLAYTLSLPMMLGAYGALATYLATGKGPQDLRDYFFPPTGELDQNGHKMRYAPPTYGKDVAGFFHQPGQTAINKLNPIWSNMFSIFQNRDFWGTQIYSPDDPWYQKGASMLHYEAGAFEPFAFSGMAQNWKQGVRGAKLIAPFVGLTPAASWIDKTPAEERASEIEDRLNAGESHTSADAATYQVKSALREQLARAGDDPKARKLAIQAITDAIRAKTIQPSDAEKIAAGAMLSPLERMVKGIGMEYESPTKYDPRTGYKMLLSIYDKASPDEARMIYRYLGPIYGRARATGADVGPPPPPPPPGPKPLNTATSPSLVTP